MLINVQEIKTTYKHYWFDFNTDGITSRSILPKVTSVVSKSSFPLNTIGLTSSLVIQLHLAIGNLGTRLWLLLAVATPLQS